MMGCIHSQKKNTQQPNQNNGNIFKSDGQNDQREGNLDSPQSPTIKEHNPQTFKIAAKGQDGQNDQREGNFESPLVYQAVRSRQKLLNQKKNPISQLPTKQLKSQEHQNDKKKEELYQINSEIQKQGNNMSKIDAENFSDRNEESEYDAHNESYYMEEEYQYQDEVDLNLVKGSSISQQYTFCSTQTILSRIYDEIRKIMNMTCLQYQWAFQLYAECQWQMPSIYKLMDLKSTFQEVILFKQDYKPFFESSPRQCEVCLEKQRLIANSCGHAYCINCWTSFLQVHTFQNSGLFPTCQGDSCNQKMNYKLSHLILESSINSKLKKKFNRILIASYSQYNDSVKICPDDKCENKFLINDLTFLPIICKCGLYVCAYCGKKYHYPIECAEEETWMKLNEKINKELSENIWVQKKDYKLCPKCKAVIQKNGGCNHMTCTCRYQFCWVCLQNWKIHGKCQQQGIQQQMDKQQIKMFSNGSEYRQAFKSAFSKFERYWNQEKRINSYNCKKIQDGLIEFGVPISNVGIIQSSKYYLLVALQFLKAYIIYSFFRKDNGEQILQMYQKRIEAQLKDIDRYLLQIQQSYQIYEMSFFEIYETTEEQVLKQDSLKQYLKEELLENKRKIILEKLSVSNQFLMKVFGRK